MQPLPKTGWRLSVQMLNNDKSTNTTTNGDARNVRPHHSFFSDWIGVAPFFIFTLFFIVLPSVGLVSRAFQDNAGNFTLQNFANLFTREILSSYWISIRISFTTAVAGGLLGFLMAYAITVGKLPAGVRSVILTFSGVASNFAGVPLAFAFVATMGRTGMITVLLKNVFHINIYNMGFNLYSFLGLSLTYTFFQFPLMILVITPALDGLKTDWREAAENLGASQGTYLRKVMLPILTPSILGGMILLFGNSFGAYATAYSLTGGFLNLITIMVGAQIKGDVLYNPGLGYALAVGMVIVMLIMMIFYYLLRQRSERWLRK